MKSKSLSDLSLAEKESETLTYSFETEDDNTTKSPTFSGRSTWKAQLIGFIDKIEDICSKPTSSITSSFCKKERLHVLIAKNTPQLIFYTTCSALIVLWTFIHFHDHYHNQAVYAKAYVQSFGLFQSIANTDWLRLKEYYHKTNPHKFGAVETFVDEPSVWYQYNWNINFICPQEERIGIVPQMNDPALALGSGDNNVVVDQQKVTVDTSSQPVQITLGDGPKWVCNPRDIVRVVNNRMTSGNAVNKMIDGGGKGKARNGCLIYSIGVNAKQIGFELGIQRLLTGEAERTIPGYKKGKPFCEIHVFDPDSYHEKIRIGEGVEYHNWGIRSSSDEKGKSEDEKSEVQFKSFQESIKELGHEGHAIDIMKVDCKMCEWSIYKDWFDKGNDENGPSSYRGPSVIHQLLVEVHGTPELSVNPFFERIRDENYVIFHKDTNTETYAGTSQDYAFLRLSPEFFKE